MVNEIDKQMMLKFLQRNYPVARFKQNMRFKRGILLDNGGIYFLNKTDINTSNQPPIIQLLSQIIIKVFSCNELMARTIVKEFLKLN